MLDNHLPDTPEERESNEELADLAAPLEASERAWVIYQHAQLCFKLAGTLTSFLGFGWKWMAAFVRLMVYTAILWPGFLAMIVFYFLSPRVIRNVPYGREPRNRLDLYIPYRKWLAAGNVPVVIFVTGGAWMIGYKAWGALLGRRLSQQGVIVACLDYRNFPQGRAPEMVADVSRGIGWVLSHIHSVGGDRKQVYVVGQSCGGHLALMAIYQRVVQLEALSKLHSQRGEAKQGVDHDSDSPSQSQHNASSDGMWSIPCHVSDSEGSQQATTVNVKQKLWNPSQIKGFVAVSCPFDVESLVDHFNRRGMTRHLFRCIMSESADAEGLAAMNPIKHLREAPASLIARLPPILCLHGTEDATVPYGESLKLQSALKEHGMPATCKLYPRYTHTWPLIEGPMAGGRDTLMEDILNMVKGDSPKEYMRTYPMLPFPRITTWLARLVCPF